jgi:hypothetical protein
MHVINNSAWWCRTKFCNIIIEVVIQELAYIKIEKIESFIKHWLPSKQAIRLCPLFKRHLGLNVFSISDAWRVVINNSFWSLHPNRKLPQDGATFFFAVLGARITVSIETVHGLDGQGVRVRVPVGALFFSSPNHPDRFWGPPSILSRGYWGLSLGAKLPGCEADHPCN